MLKLEIFMTVVTFVLTDLCVTYTRIFKRNVQLALEGYFVCTLMKFKNHD